MALIPYEQGLLKNIDHLPPHITFDQYNDLRDQVHRHWRSRKGKKSSFYLRRDLLFVDLLWTTGGRVDDICHINIRAIDFQRKQLHLYTKKRKKTVVVILDDTTLLDVSEYLRLHQPQGHLFSLTRQHAWRIIRRYGKLAQVPHLHPHMFRHGLAIYLLNQRVPIPVIAARLGHSNVHMTMQMYMKITPEIQELHIKDVQFRR